jgi:hypothetical protein
MSGYTNGEDKGAHPLVAKLIERHEQRIDGLEEILKKGFDTVAEELRETRGTLIDAVAGKKQVPLMSHLFTVAVLGIFCIVLLVKIAAVSVSASTSGFHAQPMGGNAQRPDN